MAASVLNRTKFNSMGKDTAEMIMMGSLVSSQVAIKLMQNCDLPPPVKVFSWPENVHKMIADSGNDDDDKLGLLSALTSSQTRAREAERKAEALAKEKDLLAKALLEDSMRLLGYRQRLKMLEVQV